MLLRSLSIIIVLCTIPYYTAMLIKSEHGLYEHIAYGFLCGLAGIALAKRD